MRNFLKNSICLVLAFVLALVLAGCDYVKDLLGMDGGETLKVSELWQAPEAGQSGADGDESAEEIGQGDEPAGTADGSADTPESAASDGQAQDADEQIPDTSEDGEQTGEDGEELIVGTGTGQVLPPTYQADSRFSLNSVAGATFNPYMVDSTWNQMVSMLAYEPMVRADGNFEAQPNLITRWDSEDGITWRFYVDTTRMFHSGGHLTPSDAMYSLEMARGYLSRFSKRFSDIRGIDIGGEDSFIVTLNEANWRFYELMTIPCIELNTGGSDTPPGTGPYMFNKRLTALTLDPNYPHADEMPIKKIYLKKYTAPEDIREAFETALLDMVINSPADMSSLGYSSANIIKYVDTTNMHYIGYNAKSRLFSQPMFRAMVTYAIDRDTIVSNAMQGAAVAATLPIHPNSSLYPKQLAQSLTYSQERLQIAMQGASVMDVDNDGIMEVGGSEDDIIFLVCSDSAAKVTAARQIANSLRSAGFSITMREMNRADYQLAMEKGEFDMYYAEVKICNDWDLTALFSPNSTLNYGELQDTTLLNYIREFLASGSDRLAESANNLYEYFSQTAPITPICFEKSEVLYHRGVLGTISPTQDNIFNDMYEWDVGMEFK